MPDTPERPISIAQVSTADVAGGAERVAFDLHREYLRRGHDATLVVGHRYGSAERVAVIPNASSRGPWTRLWNSFAPNPSSPHQALPQPLVALRRACQVVGDPVRALRVLRGYEDMDFPGTHVIPDLAQPGPGVLHLHNLHGGYFDLRALPALAAQVPLVVTAHDLWLATGHCAQPVDCERWRTGCGDCPHLEYPPAARADRTHDNWTMKRELYSKLKLHLAAPSAWALAQLEHSILEPAVLDSRVIANGVDQSVFRPGDRARARDELGIPADAAVVAFTVADARSPYKDQPTIANALGLVAKSLVAVSGAGAGQPLVFLAIGVPRLAAPAPAGVEVVCLPFSPDPADVARALHATDVYVHAARAETLGLGILEAQSCGVPAVVTRTGGAPETMRDGETGFVVSQGDAEEMARRVADILTDDDLRTRLGSAAYAFAKGRFSTERMADEYLDVYMAAIQRHTTHE